jgi:hypothetical protein
MESWTIEAIVRRMVDVVVRDVLKAKKGGLNVRRFINMVQLGGTQVSVLAVLFVIRHTLLCYM